MRPLVLFIEDDEMLATVVPSLLRDEGIEVIVLREGRPAIGAIAQYEPRAVILDVSLPDVHGLVVARAIRDAWPALPIIFSTGYGESAVDADFQDARMAVLQKPYDIASLIALLGELDALNSG